MDRITALNQKLDPLEPLPADDTSLYVDWQKSQLGSGDLKLQLARACVRRGSSPVTRLFTGHRGTGKTTELLRVKKMLEGGFGGRKMFVSYLECGKWLNLDDLRPEDLVLQLVRQIVSDLRDAGHTNAWSKVTAFFRDWAEMLKSEVALKDFDLTADPFKIGVAIKQVPGARANLRKHLEDRLPRIYDLVNSDILGPARQWLRDMKGIEDVLVIVDELDRLPLRTINERHTNHEHLFLDSSNVLRALECSVIYTIPIELAYSHCHGRLSDIYGGAILTLPMITVSSDGLKRLVEIVELRAKAAGIGLQELCDRDQLERVCQLSGGHPRSLFTLLRSALDRADELPLTEAIVSEAILQEASDFGRSLSEEQWSALRQVHKDHKPLNADLHRDRWMTFLRERYVYPYYDPRGGGLTYDWNPLLEVLTR